MNVLIDIGHPGHVHLFRNLAKELEVKDYDVTFVYQESQLITELITYYGLKGRPAGKKRKHSILKYFYQMAYAMRSVYIASRKNVMIGIGVSMTLPLVAALSRMKSITMDDDDQAVTPLFALMAGFAGTILTPSSLAFEKRGNNHISYQGFHELAYLHPKRFSPDPSVLRKLGLEENEIFFLLRFNSFRAHHDVGEGGMSFSQKLILIHLLEQKGKVFISSESGLEPGFENNMFNIPPQDLHSMLYYARLYAGESQTITSEAAVLGTPAIKCNTFAGRLSIPNELEEKYGLCYSFLPDQFDKMIAKIEALLEMPDLKVEWQQRRMRMLDDKIDVTDFLVWFIENYPYSMVEMKKDPSYALRFK